jgi:tetratricopeptide (TPR) repeat protein
MNRHHQARFRILLLVVGATIAFASSFARTTPRDHVPRNSESFARLAAQAQAAMDAGRLTEAIQLYARATKLRPSWFEGWWHLGTLYFDSSRFTEARAAFLHFVEVEKKQPGPGFGMLGLTDFQLKQYPEALTALEHGWKLGLGTNPSFTHTVLFHIGILRTRMGEPEIGLERLTLLANQIAAAHPEAPKNAVLSDADLISALGIAALRIPKLPSEILVSQSSVVRQAGHAQALIALQEGVAADAELKQLIGDYPSEPGVHYMYGVFLLKEHPPLAVGEFRREIEVAPNNAAAHIQLALELLRTADYEQGLKYAKEAVALAPQSFVGHIAYGRLWLAVGKIEPALQELRTAVKLAPSSPDAHFALSRALSEAGQNAEAAHERAEFEHLQALSQAAER